MGRYFGREPRYSAEELEMQAKAAIEARVNMGRPPAEDFLPVEARLAALDRELAARAPAVPLPPPPPARRREEHAPLSVTEVRLPAAAKASRPAPAKTRAKAGGTAVGTGNAAPAPKPRAPRRAVAAKEG